jgi:hypothetical protein
MVKSIEPIATRACTLTSDHGDSRTTLTVEDRDALLSNQKDHAFVELDIILRGMLRSTRKESNGAGKNKPRTVRTSPAK